MKLPQTLHATSKRNEESFPNRSVLGTIRKAVLPASGSATSSGGSPCRLGPNPFSNLSPNHFLDPVHNFGDRVAFACPKIDDCALPPARRY
jgi:hypothetical protein